MDKVKTKQRRSVVMADNDAHRILKGPSRFDLMIALFEGKSVDFTITNLSGYPEKVPARITSIGVKDRSKKTWLIEGDFTFRFSVLYFKGHFNSQGRQGWIRLIQP